MKRSHPSSSSSSGAVSQVVPAASRTATPRRKKPQAAKLSPGVQQRMYKGEEIQQLRPHLEELFNLLDSYRDGRVDREALTFALHVNGCVYEAKKQLIMKIVDEGHPAGLYDLATFTDILMSEIASRSTDEEIERTFKLFMRYAGEGEEDHIVSTPLPENAAILPEDLKRLTRVLGVSVPLEELQDMIHEFDTTNGGTSVNMNDWRAVVSLRSKGEP